MADTVQTKHSLLAIGSLMHACFAYSVMAFVNGCYITPSIAYFINMKVCISIDSKQQCAHIIEVVICKRAQLECNY